MSEFDDTRDTCLGRDRHRCVRCGLYVRNGQWPGWSCHHRMNRLRADPAWRHKPANCVTLCGTGTTGCHGWVHQHPEAAHETGYYLRAGEDPHEKTVTNWQGDQLLYDDEGQQTTLRKGKRP